MSLTDWVPTMFGGAGLIGGIGAAAGVASGIVNTAKSFGAEKWNRAFAEKQFAQNQANLEESWRREDSAVQRRAEDMKLAGVNPLLAAGAGAGTGMMSHSGGQVVPGQVGDFNSPAKTAMDAIMQKNALQQSTGEVLLLKENINSARLQNAELANKITLELDLLREQIAGRKADTDRTEHDTNWYRDRGLRTTPGSKINDVAGAASYARNIIESAAADMVTLPNPASLPSLHQGWQFIKGKIKGFSDMFKNAPDTYIR